MPELTSLLHELAQGQWEALFQQTGFKLTKMHPTRGLFTVTEAKAA